MIKVFIKNILTNPLKESINDVEITHKWPPLFSVSAKAFRSRLSLSNTPHVVCMRLSSRQSPADLFHKACSRDPRCTVTSKDQLMTGGSSSSWRWASLSSSSSNSCSWMDAGSSSISSALERNVWFLYKIYLSYVLKGIKEIGLVKMKCRSTIIK